MKVAWPVSVCEYQFIDEGLADLTERLKEMLDIDVTVNDLDITQEIPAEIGEKSIPTGKIHKVVLCVHVDVLYLYHFFFSDDIGIHSNELMSFK